MRLSFKKFGLSVLSLSLLVCGCGDGKSGSGSGDGGGLSSFKPLAAKDAKFAVAVNLDKAQAFKVVDSYMKMVSDMHLFEGDSLEAAKETIEKYRNDIFADLDQEKRAFIEKSGLRDARLEWAAMSLEDFRLEKGEPNPVGLSVAIGGKLELEKLIDASQGEKDCKASFEKIEIEGEKAWCITPQDESDTKEMKEKNIEPCVASLDGRLVLLAISRDTLAKQIRLYRKGADKGDAVKGFSAAKGELMRLHLSGIGDLVKKNSSKGELRMIGNFVPDGDKLVCGLQDLTIDTKVKLDGMLSETIRLKTASEEDADKLRTLAKTGLMAATAQMSRNKNMPEDAKKMIQEVKIGGSDGVVEVQSGIASAGIMAGALFPAVSSAMLSANTAAMSANGRNLLMGIIMANTEREAAGKPSVWPCTIVDASADADDIAGKAYRSSTDYFNALFDMERYGTADWEPYVDKSLLERLSGAGVPKMDGKRLEGRNVAWTVAANVLDHMPDGMPVLISANFNPALLLRKWDGKSNRFRRLPIGPGSGAGKSMFGDKAIVIVRKGGTVEAIKAKDLTYDRLYQGQEFDATATEHPLVYLTPTGAVEPVGRR